MYMKALTRIAASMLIVLSVGGCSETPTSRYASTTDAARDGAFTRGWLPAVLAPDATQIEEIHDQDSNKGSGTFALNQALIKRLESVCKPVHGVPIPESNAHWWQKGPDSDRQPSGALYQCEDFLVLVNADKGAGRFWTSPR
jgi:hypothetical protein